jgi:hypothetical protein
LYVIAAILSFEFCVLLLRQVEVDRAGCALAECLGYRVVIFLGGVSGSEEIIDTVGISVPEMFANLL